MLSAVAFVAANPGCAILPVAKHLHVGARRGTNNALGYNPINRAIKAGLLLCYPCPVNRSRSRLLTPEQSAGLSTLTRVLAALG